VAAVSAADRCAKLAAGSTSNIQKHSRFPVVAMFLDRETMERDRFDVSPLLMTGVVQLFAGEFRFQKICFAFLVNLRFAGSQ